MSRQTMTELVERYLAMRENKGYAASTVANERSALSRLARHWDKARKSPRNLNAESMEDYLYGPGGISETSGLAPSTFNTQLQYLRGFLQWLHRRGVVTADLPDALQRLKTDKPEYLRISLGQIGAAIDTCADPWEKWLLTLASQTLGRDGELRNLKAGAFNLDTGYVAWYRQKTGQHDELPVTETLEAGYREWMIHYQEVAGVVGKDAYALPRRRLLPAIPARPAAWTYIPGQHRTSCCSPVIQDHVSRVTGIPVTALKGQGVHILRRSMARALYDRLKDQGDAYALDTVQAMLGHANQRTTEIYIGLQAGRERRNDLLRGSRLLSADKTNVIELGVRNGTASGM